MWGPADEMQMFREGRRCEFPALRTHPPLRARLRARTFSSQVEFRTKAVNILPVEGGPPKRSRLSLVSRKEAVICGLRQGNSRGRTALRPPRIDGSTPAARRRGTAHVVHLRRNVAKDFWWSLLKADYLALL